MGMKRNSVGEGRSDGSLDDVYFFPEHLAVRLSRIPDYPVTLVEAPSGFGKTTAVREYLRNNLPEGACENWYTCLGEAPSQAWEGICRLFREVDVSLAEGLKEQYPLTSETLGNVAGKMRECCGDTGNFIVIDNYQLFETTLQRELIDAFSVHSDLNLHIIFITQILPLSTLGVHNVNIHKLVTKDFFFDRESTARYCHLSGIKKITDQKLDDLQNTSEGWISAIRLQVGSYKKTGSFVKTGDLKNLIETAVWSRLDETNREFLLAVSLLDGFTSKQAAIMGAWPVLPESITTQLTNNFFIRYIADKRVYSIHSILRDYLLSRFDDVSSDFAEEMTRRAGEACASVSDYLQAGRFYLNLRDYDAILSLPFATQYLNSMKESGISEFLELFVDECPEDILRKYPFVVLTFAFHFLKSDKPVQFDRLMKLLHKILTEPLNIPEGAVTQIKSEVALITSLTHFNDIKKMSEYHKKAYSYLNANPGGSRTLIFGTTPWTFGITSVMFLYWSHVGELDCELSVMEECLPIYSNLTGGHGIGGDSVMRAEAYLARGDDAASEVACYKAIYQAQGVRQTSICLCAELVLAKIALLRGDGRAYAETREKIFKDAAESRQTFIVRMGELCLASLDLTVETTEGLPDWLRDIENIRKILYTQGQPYGLALHGHLLLLEGRHAELYGLTDVVMGLARERHYLLPQVYQLIYLAAAKHLDGFGKEAVGHLRDALNIALSDKVYLPFAEHGSFILPMLEAVKREFDFGQMDTLIALCRRQISGTGAVKKALSLEKPVLTPRQREIALLMKDGLSAKEIASELFITENTVKSAIKIIYDKLDIHSKTSLAKIEL
jgi:LuxR family maltose regulon positive regulatory protein